MKQLEKVSAYKEWFKEGVSRGANYMLIVETEYDGLMPVFVFPEQSLEEEVKRFARDNYYTVHTYMDLVESMDDQVNAAAAPKHRLVSRVEV